ncbi:MAG: ATP-dependent DNA helicase RecG [Candidatus Parcubacteria bacterium]|nr:MAG: ATP-dependent DNA helicase RecG [Candidatus Parcubacteria bacterium]
MKLEDLEIDLTEFKGIGYKTALKLAKNNLKTIKDLLYYFPYKYQDLSQIQKIEDLKINQEAVVVGKLTNVKFFSSPRKRMFILQGIISDQSGSLKVVWYNQPFLVKTLAGNPNLLVYGRLVKNKFGLNLQSPKFEVLKNNQLPRNRIIPVYSTIENLTSNFFEKLIKEVLEKYDLNSLVDPLPEKILTRFGYPMIGQAFHYIHNPKNLDQVTLAKERFAFEELFYLQLALAQERQNIKKNKAAVFNFDEQLTNQFISQLKFTLTNGQKKVIEEIFNDLKTGKPMNRLLQGETGAGKTLIAEILALNMAVKDYQTIFMAPTEILAQQHFSRLLKDFAGFNFGLALITSGGIYYGENGFKTAKNINFLKRFLASGKIKILIGTHALIENQLSFNKVGLVIIDEQQRFGLEQRRKLIEQTNQNFLPHFLSMSATPIPRTLALAFYGDLDFSQLIEKPFGQQPIKTYLVLKEKEENMWRFVLKEIKEGHQVFVVCPRVEEKEDEVKSVKAEYERIKEIFTNFFQISASVKIGMLHGKMKSVEKEKILRQMQNNEIQILVSSSVVEVGIDLPLATVIIIQSPERFGLAQLYQLRGRVGRSVHQGYCFLLPQKLSPKSRLRLKYFLQAQSALELAEYDLRLRGGGELLGEKQAGIPDLAMKSLTNVVLLEKVKNFVQEFFNQDFNFDRYPYLKKEVLKRKKLLFV